MYLNKPSRQLLFNFLQKKDFIKKAWLYGSYAKGSADKNSDIDVLVELDYVRLSGRGWEFLELSNALSAALGNRVSLVSKQALSSSVEPFVFASAILIYDSNGMPENIWLDYLPINFDKKEYRDKALLDHIQQSLSSISQWLSDYHDGGTVREGLYISAFSKELQLISGFVKRLTADTRDELTKMVPWPGINIVGGNIFSLLKNLTGPYLGIDKDILLDIVRNELPPYQSLVEDLIQSWEDRYKLRLSAYFLSYLLRLVKTNGEQVVLDTEEVVDVGLAIRQTVNLTPLLRLTTEYIGEGERNIGWIASQLNAKRFWKDLKNEFCPFFPIC